MMNLVAAEKNPFACFRAGVQMLIFRKGGARSTDENPPQPGGHKRSFPTPSLRPSWASFRCPKVPALSEATSTLEISVA